MKEIGKRIGSNLPSGTTQFTLFVPSKNRDGRAIKQEKWVTAALEVFGKLFRGATAFPPGRGVWRDDDRNGQLVWDESVMVVSYAKPNDVTAKSLSELRHFLHTMGREAGQGEIGIVIDGAYYGISKYDE
jgi:hypothetical protein